MATTATLDTPAHGEKLSSTTVYFHWGGGSGVTDYYVWVGNTLGAGDIVQAYAATSTSTTITGLPMDGRTLYVRLWSFFAGGSFGTNDYSFTAGPIFCDVQVQRTTNVWESITRHTVSQRGLRIDYGVRGNGPTDCVAGTGECEFWLNNAAAASGRLQGQFSPGHANCLTGWTYGIPCRVVFADPADTAKAISSIVRVSATATVTTSSAHGYTTGWWVSIAGAVQTDYNGVFQITVTGASTFTYTVSGTPTTPATGTRTATHVYIKHRGKVNTIEPEAGRYASQMVRVLSYDGMRDLAETEVRRCTVQTDKTASQLKTTVLAAVPTESQPVAQSFATTTETYPYALHDLGTGTKALSVLKDIAVASYTFVAMKGDGTLFSLSRQTRQVPVSSYTFSDTMHAFTAPNSLESVFNAVRVTIHPLTIDDEATTVLYADQTVRTLPPLAITDFWVTYTNPNDTSGRLIGGMDVGFGAVVSTTLDGSGDQSGTVFFLGPDYLFEPFGSSCHVRQQNLAPFPLYFVDVSGNPSYQIVGRGVYDLGPRTYESASTQTYGKP